jgi:hypothetical protein
LLRLTYLENSDDPATRHLAPGHKAAAVEKLFSFNALEKDRQELEQAAILTPASPEATDAKTETKRKNVWVLTSANVM